MLSYPDGNPLYGVTEYEAGRFYDKYKPPIEKDVFVRGVLALRSQMDMKTKFEEIHHALPTLLSETSSWAVRGFLVVF